VVVGGALDTYKKAVSFRAAKTIFKRTASLDISIKPFMYFEEGFR